MGAKYKYKEETSHDLQGNPSIVKDDTKDHTYHVLKTNAEGHQKLDNEVQMSRQPK